MSDWYGTLNLSISADSEAEAEGALVAAVIALNRAIDVPADSRLDLIDEVRADDLFSPEEDA
jgi:hypothetical protein